MPWRYCSQTACLVNGTQVVRVTVGKCVCLHGYASGTEIFFPSLGPVFSGHHRQSTGRCLPKSWIVCGNILGLHAPSHSPQLKPLPSSTNPAVLSSSKTQSFGSFLIPDQHHLQGNPAGNQLCTSPLALLWNLCTITLCAVRSIAYTELYHVQSLPYSLPTVAIFCCCHYDAILRTLYPNFIIVIAFSIMCTNYSSTMIGCSLVLS